MDKLIIKTPKFNNREMKKIKEYLHFVLYEDEKTGIKEAFSYWDLTHKIVNGLTYKYNKNGKLVLCNIERHIPNLPIKRNDIKSDNRLNEIIKNKRW